MECVLLWLDELDDLLASGLFVWPRVRTALLSIGLVCAVLVHVAAAVDFPDSAPAYLLVQLALGSIVVWGCGGLLAAAFDRSLHPVP